MYSKQEQLNKVKESKPKYRKKCKVCRVWFRSDRQLQVVCDNIDCALSYSKKQIVKQQRQAKTAFNQSDKSKQKQKAQSVFNKYIRLRDKGKGCISCGHKGDRQIHCGHYKPQGNNQQLRYNMLNCHAQCSICNNHLSGNLVPYRENLIKKIGLIKVEALESDKSIKKYDIEYLQKLIRVFNKKIKRIERC